MLIGPYRFSPPGWIPTVVTAAFLALLLNLGFWQLGKADAKAAMLERRAQSGETGPVAASALGDDAEALRYTRVIAKGRYLADRQFLLDNRTHGGRAGYHVITPLELVADGSVLLINRGWVPVGADRATLPDVAVDPGPREVRGEVTVAVADAFLLGDAGYEGEAWPRVVQRLEPGAIAAALKSRVREPILRLDGAEADGFIREWPAHWGITPERHQGYAVQWFSLATALVTIYLVVNLRKAKGPDS